MHPTDNFDEVKKVNEGVNQVISMNAKCMKAS
jgi:hypothetical protein